MARRHVVTCMALLALMACSTGAGNNSNAATGRPNIILISVDTLRADHLGAWGYTRQTSPFLDQLAAAGTRFANNWAPAPWTVPSHATLLTGLAPRHHGATRKNLSIASNATMLTEALHIGGYSTFGVVTSMFVTSRYGFARGFDEFSDFGILGGEEQKPGGPDAGEAFAKVLDWADGQDDRPIFAFVHLYDVHYPYAPPPPFGTKFDRASTEDEQKYRHYLYYTKHPVNPGEMKHQTAQYDEEIAYVDHAIQDFHTSWTADRPNTIFVIVSDHGEELGERRAWGHAHTLYPEQLHIPWIVSGPGIAAQVIEERTSLADVATTIADLVGVEFTGTDGINRGEQLRSGKAPSENTVPAQFASTYRHQTIRHRWHQPPWDLIQDLNRGSVQLFNLEKDPAGRRVIRKRPPKVVEKLRRAMYEELGEPWAAPRGGVVTTTGAIVVDSVWKGKRTELEPGTSFAVFPPDAPVEIDANGEKAGPFAAVGGELPAGNSLLRWSGQVVESESAELTAEQMKRLRALGYIN